MHLRQVTACADQTEYTTFRRHRQQLAWQIYTCTRHRRLPDWSTPGNLQRLAAEESRPRCGTVYDYRPHAEVIVSHLHGWMGATGLPDGMAEPAPDDWQAHLRIARETALLTRQASLQAAVDELLHLAETGSTGDIIILLAQAETRAAEKRRR